jgi:hypothetical protein
MTLEEFLVVSAIPLVAGILVRWIDSVGAADPSNSGLYGEW